MISCSNGYTGRKKKGEDELSIQISLAAARVNAGYTQSEVANKMGVTKQTVVNWEKGKNKPGVPQVNMLSRIYNIPIDNIFLPNNSTLSR